MIDAVSSNNSNAGGSVVRRGDEGFVVRGIGLVRSLDDLGNIVVTQKSGTPMLVRNLGELQLGALERNGILGKDDNPDGVSGIVLLLRGENPSRVLEGVHAKVEALNHGLLPPDVKVVPYLDRTDLVNTTLHTVSHTLLEGMALVVVVLMLFLGSVRSALIVAITIPLSLLIAFILMHLTNIPANLLSLGAIDFGIIVDGAIVVMENILRRREAHPDKPLTEGEARTAATQVARPIFFATVIIITAYIPLFAFQRVEKKLFSPHGLHGRLRAGRRDPGGAGAGPRAGAGRLQPARGSSAQPGAGLARRAATTGPCAAVAAAPAAGARAGRARRCWRRSCWRSPWARSSCPSSTRDRSGCRSQLPPGISLQKASEMATELRTATREFPEVSLRRHPARAKRRRHRPLDAVAHRVRGRPASRYDTWPAGETKHDLIAQAERPLRAHPRASRSASRSR